jgi:threonine/homoserine/homoserine lactone efflux protein
MFDHAQLVTFIAVAVALVVIPGPNTVLILATSLAGGRRAGIATVFGVETGTLVHSVAAGIGVSTVIATSPAMFAAVKYAGVVYLGYLGLREWFGTATSHAPEPSETANAPWTRFFRRALVTSVLNPKATAFFVALLPQFVDRSRGYVLIQFVTFGAIVALIGLAVGLVLTLALTGNNIRRWPWSARAELWQARVMGAVLLALGVCLALSDS